MASCYVTISFVTAQQMNMKLNEVCRFAKRIGKICIPLMSTFSLLWFV